MPDFSDPKYASYVELCRELRLKRPFGESIPPRQQFKGWDQLEAEGEVFNYGLSQDFDAWAVKESADPIWLPALADWLEMLEERQLVVCFGSRGEFVRGQGQEFDAWIEGGPDVQALTREEALARLWMAVTGRTAPTT